MLTLQQKTSATALITVRDSREGGGEGGWKEGGFRRGKVLSRMRGGCRVGQQERRLGGWLGSEGNSREQ